MHFNTVFATDEGNVWIPDPKSQTSGHLSGAGGPFACVASSSHLICIMRTSCVTKDFGSFILLKRDPFALSSAPFALSDLLNDSA